MRERSELWQKIAVRGDFGMEVEAVIGGKSYTAITAPMIERALCDSALSVGNCIAASLKFSVLAEEVIPPSSGVVIRARLRQGEDITEWKDFGTFYIDRREEQEGLVTLQCFDAMLKAGQQYADPTDPEDRIGWPKTMRACVEEVAYRIGVEIDPRTVIKTDAPYQVPYPDKLTMQRVLGYIGACHGGNWIITPENKLRLVTLVSPPAETFNIIDYEYNRIYTGGGYKLVWKHTETGETVEHPSGGGLVHVPVVTGSIAMGQAVRVTRVTLGADEDLGYTKGDSTGGEIRIEGNPYACQAICDDLFTAYNGLEYASYAIAGGCFDPCTELGDWVLVGDRVRSVLYKYTMTFGTDFRADCEAPYREEASSEYPYLSVIKQLKQTDKLLEKYMEAQKDEIHSQILQTRTNILLEVSGTYATQEQVSSSIQLSADNILAEVEEMIPGGEELEELRSSISQNAEAITTEVTRAKGQEQALSSKLEQTAKSITLSVENGTTSSTIKLTGDGITAQSKTIKFTGDMVFASDLTDGQTVISGDNIKTGSLSADRIAGGTLVLGGKSNGNGVLKVLSSNGGEIGTWDNTGLHLQQGEIQGTTIKVGGINNRYGTLDVLGNDDVLRMRASRNTLRFYDSTSYEVGQISCDNTIPAPGSFSHSLYIGLTDSNTSGIFFTDDGSVYVNGDAVNISGKAQFDGTPGAGLYLYAIGQSSSGWDSKLVADPDGPAGSNNNFRLYRGTSSSSRYKEVGKPLQEEDIEALYKITPRWAKYKDGYLQESDERCGIEHPMFIAEDMEKYAPLAVDHDREGRAENWNYRVLLPYIFQMLKSQKEQIEKLEKALCFKK